MENARYAVDEVQLFSEDVVVDAENPQKIGIVSRVAGDSDDEDEEDMEDREPEVPAGHALVYWLKARDVANEPLKSVMVVDRSLLHGDIVARVAEPLGQSGTVVEVYLSVDLESPSGVRIKGVDSKCLQMLRPFQEGNYVFKGHWLGRVVEVTDNLTILFDDGAKCKVSDVTPEALYPVNETVTDGDSQSPYYPGQRVKAPSGFFFRSAQWLKGTWKSNRTQGTVAEMEAGMCRVNWITTGTQPELGACPVHRTSEPPPEALPAGELMRLEYYAYTRWQLGDRAILPRSVISGEVATADVARDDEKEFGPSTSEREEPLDASALDSAGPSILREEDVQNVPSVSNAPQPLGGGLGGLGGLFQVGRVGKKRRESKKERKRAARSEEMGELPWQIVGTKTRVDVVWQDSTREEGLDACHLLPVEHMGDHDFWPDEYVVERGTELELEQEEAGPQGGQEEGELGQGQGQGQGQGAGGSGGAEGEGLGEGQGQGAGGEAGQGGEGGGASSAGGNDSSGGSSSRRRMGLVKSVNARERIALVQWMKRPAGGTGAAAGVGEGAAEMGGQDEGDPMRDVESIETLPVYELAAHADFSYRLGDVVLSLGARSGQKVKVNRLNAGTYSMVNPGVSTGVNTGVNGVVVDAGEGGGATAAAAEADAELAATAKHAAAVFLEAWTTAQVAGVGMPASSVPGGAGASAEGDRPSCASGGVCAGAGSSSCQEQPREGVESASTPGAPAAAGGAPGDPNVKSPSPPPPPLQDKAWVGEIIGREGGYVKVAWADGVITQEGPCALYVASLDDEEEEEAEYDEDAEVAGQADDEDAVSWETVDDVSVDDWSGAAVEAEEESWDKEAQGHLNAESAPGIESEPSASATDRASAGGAGRAGWEPQGPPGGTSSSKEARAEAGAGDGGGGGGSWQAAGLPDGAGQGEGSKEDVTVLSSLMKKMARFLYLGKEGQERLLGAVDPGKQGVDTRDEVDPGQHPDQRRGLATSSAGHDRSRGGAEGRASGSGDGGGDGEGKQGSGGDGVGGIGRGEGGGGEGRGGEAASVAPGAASEEVLGEAPGSAYEPALPAAADTCPASEAAGGPPADATRDGSSGSKSEGKDKELALATSSSSSSAHAPAPAPAAATAGAAAKAPVHTADAPASGSEEEEPAGAAAEAPVHIMGMGASRLEEEQEDGTRQRERALKHFDSVSDASDHHYVGETAQASGKKWARKVQQEWAILENNLPDTIYVRVYEERMDLMRALIVGPADTPYQDGLFVFDIWLPSDYPTSPPVVYYHSGGLRLNPNLYETGKVCLSLLNTWTGRGTETWTPTSTVLQVLVSLQGLVLVPKPYFNEAGYERQIATPEGERNSLIYNESAFLLSCKSMMYLVRRPPLHVGELVRAHFRERGPHILARCDAYVADEALSGSESAAAGASAQPADSSGGPSSAAGAPPGKPHKHSEGFKLMLAKLRPALAASFSTLDQTSS